MAKQFAEELIQIRPKTHGQSAYYSNLLSDAPLCICQGPSGSGKTLLAAYHAICQLRAGNINSILYLKPDVGIKGLRGIGYRPGSEQEKTNFLLAPLIDNLSVFCKAGYLQYVLDKRLVTTVPIEDCRGRSMNYTYVLCDEAQNLPANAILLILSRLGINSRLCLLGDSNQQDINNGNGLAQAIARLSYKSYCTINQLGTEDIVRNGWLADALAEFGY